MSRLKTPMRLQRLATEALQRQMNDLYELEERLASDRQELDVELHDAQEAAAGSFEAITGAVRVTPCSITRRPWVCNAASVAPRARADTVQPAAASRSPIQTPTAPGPTITARMQAPPCRRRFYQRADGEARRAWD